MYILLLTGDPPNVTRREVLQRVGRDGAERARYIYCSQNPHATWLEPDAKCEIVAVEGASELSSAALFIGKALAWSFARKGLLVLGEVTRATLLRKVAVPRQVLVQHARSVLPLTAGQPELVVGSRAGVAPVSRTG